MMAVVKTVLHCLNGFSYQMWLVTEYFLEKNPHNANNNNINEEHQQYSTNIRAGV